MESIVLVLFNPVTILVIVILALLAFIFSPYEIYFEDKKENGSTES